MTDTLRPVTRDKKLLRRVARAKRSLDAAQAALDEALAEARADGFSLREVASSAEMSHATMKRRLDALAEKADTQ